MVLVLAEPNVYDDWVLGAKEVRDADAAWPAVGAKLHHKTGVGPLTVDDETVVEESAPPGASCCSRRSGRSGASGCGSS